MAEAGRQVEPRHRPALGKLLEWQKNLVDWYGYDKLERFKAGAGDEFSASNAFETGKVAMNIDGEYRTAFIADEHPELNYGTAPFPVDDSQPDLYGAGYVTGNIIGIPQEQREPGEQAWELVKYLTTDTDALVDCSSNELTNVPTTPAAAAVAEAATSTPQFDDVPRDLQEPEHRRRPVTAAGQRQPGAASSRSSTSTRRARCDDLQAGLAEGRRADRRPGGERLGRQAP